MQEGKVVHFNLFNPQKSLFKQTKNTKSEVQTITCSNSDNCELLKHKACACRAGLWGGRCPYGRRNTQTGFTSRSMKFHSWCSDMKKQYDGIPFLDAPKMLGIVGDYVFLPYAHMDMLDILPWEGLFLKKEDFTVDTISKLANFRPRAIWGNNEIKSYQKDVPPLFLKHLSEQMPELFKQAIDADESLRKKFDSFTNIGREAVLETTTPNHGMFKDIHGGKWAWDGEKLYSSNSRASFVLVKFNAIILIPQPGEVVKITDEGQVNSDTVFRD